VTEQEIEPSVAHPARIYDFWLGGRNHYRVDREAGMEVLRSVPVLAHGARANRAFLGRAVRYLATEAGVTQFLDIGSGLPAAANTHEVAQEVVPGARVVYVDSDPTVAAHARSLLTDAPGTLFVQADLRDVWPILAAAGTLLDVSQPVAVMLLMLLHLIPDDANPGDLIANLMRDLPPGSALVISHPASDILPEQVEAGRRDYNRLSATPMTGRSHEQVTQFLDGLALVEPGLVEPQQWRPGPDDACEFAIPAWCGVAIKP
jgi:hypothetical protein